MAAAGVRWRTRCLCVLVWTLLLNVVLGYKESYTISQLSPKSAIEERLPEGVVLQTSQSENIALSIQPSKFDDQDDSEPESIVDGEEVEKHVIVARSADPNDRSSRSINIEEIPSSNNNEIDNDLEQHNKRKYYEILPTKTMDYLSDREDEQLLMSSSFGDRLSFRFPGEENRVPKARALIPSGPQIRATAVQPIFATITPKEQGRQNTEIQNIITGIVKLLNGNVNVQANSQLLNGRPGRPMNSRINNRGPPRIENVPPLPEFDPPMTPPPHIHTFIPTKTPPPYPFDRPPHVGVSLPEQIVPPMNPHRPGFHRPMPPWQRPPNRPKYPNRRPTNPGLPYKPTLPPVPLDLHDFEDAKPEEEDVVSENETNHSENILHHDDKDTVTLLNLPDMIINNKEESEEKTTTQEPTTTSTTSTTTTTEEPTTTSTTTEKPTTTTEKPTTTTEKPTTVTEKPSTTTEKPSTTTAKPTTTKSTPTSAKPIKVEKEKKKDTPIVEKVKEKQKPTENKEKVEINPLETQKEASSQSIEPSMSDSIIPSSIASPTPTEGLINHAATSLETASSSEVVKTSSINAQPLPTSSGIPYHPYRPRPGIVLDDTDFKPHGSRVRDREVPVITAPVKPPGYGEIFDVTVSAIQGPGEKGGASVHIETVNLSGHGDHDDIIVSAAAGDQGFVSIDGKRTYLNLFDTSSVSPTAVQTRPAHAHTAPPSLPSPVGVAIPADDVPPPRRPHPHQRPTSHIHTHPPHIHTHPPAFTRPAATVRIDTCIVGDDSTCDLAQNEKCRTEAGISSCQCRAGYARRAPRDPCRRVVALVLNLRVDRLYDRKVVWDSKLSDKESDPYQQMSYEAVRAIDSAFSMTPFSDDFISGTVNCLHKVEPGSQVYINFTVLIQESPETVRPAIAIEIHKHLLGVIRRRSNNIGASALWVDTPNNAVLPIYDLDECASSDLNDCHNLATCINTWGAFKCTCPEWTLDAAANSPVSGRNCQVCPNSHCTDRGQCRYANSVPYCSCSAGYYGSTCSVDGEVVGVAVGASLVAAVVIAATLLALLSWSRKWSRAQKAGLGSPVFNYMASNTVKTPPVGQPPYQVTLEERMRWAQIAEAMTQASHYGMEHHTMATRPSSAMFAGYPTLPPVPMPRMGLHGHGNGTLNTVTSRANTAASHHNIYGYTHQQTESTSSEASSHVQDRADLLVPRPKSRARSMHNQTGIYYDVDYENAPEAIYGTKGIPLSTYTVSRGPPYYRS